MAWKKSFIIFGAIVLTCNQVVYDQIYKGIIRQTMNSKMSPKDFQRRNDSIETLRALCNGQKSSYEVKKN